MRQPAVRARHRGEYPDQGRGGDEDQERGAHRQLGGDGRIEAGAQPGPKMRMAGDRGADLRAREPRRRRVARRPSPHRQRQLRRRRLRRRRQVRESACGVHVRNGSTHHNRAPCSAAVPGRAFRDVSCPRYWVVVRIMATPASATGAQAQHRLYGESPAESAPDAPQEPESGSPGRFASWEDRLVRMHPAAAVASVAVAGYAVVCLVFAALGALAIHQWGAMTRWDDHVVRYLDRAPHDVAQRLDGLRHEGRRHVRDRRGARRRGARAVRSPVPMAGLVPGACVGARADDVPHDQRGGGTTAAGRAAPGIGSVDVELSLRGTPPR